MKKEVLSVSGMSCAHCEARVNAALEALNGVKKSKASAKKSVVEIKFDENAVDIEKIKSVINDLGYEVK